MLLSSTAISGSRMCTWKRILGYPLPGAEADQKPTEKSDCPCCAIGKEQQWVSSLAQVCGFGGFPEDRPFIFPLKNIMGFGEGGTLDPVKSHLAEPCQEASTSNHKVARLAQPILRVQCQQSLSAPWVAGGDMWSVSSPFCQALEQLRMWPENPAAFLHPFKTSC
ncbi:hypothetical protein WISP_81375 [Willisornis vidua]|uniref:Uncharacterized protein n=1 Tax=Willisornis vidua TaxID=1566151 RepID=A0ABQ9D936_9PASS|nr:hypothetical protein WISP_81375 [Willisornis vidua]